MSFINDLTIGISCFTQGIKLCFHPDLRRYAIIPLMINCVITAIGLYFAFNWASECSTYLTENFLPSWLSFLKWLVTTIFWLLILIITFYGFTTVTLLIGSPFYTLLSEKAELILTGEPLPEMSMMDSIKDIPHTIGLELLKFIYRIPLIIINIILLFVPVLGPVLILLINAWFCALDYTSYSFENNRISYKETRATLKQHKLPCLSFGLVTWLALMIPVINFMIVPIAVCGGTILWKQRMRDQFAEQIKLRRAQAQQTEQALLPK